jgi:hypothetical protein
MGRKVHWGLLILAVIILSCAGGAVGQEKAPPPAPTAATPAPTPAKAETPDPQEVLRQACDFLKKQQQFSFKAECADDRVYTEGKKLQFDFDLEAYVQRPDKLRINAAGDLENKQFFYDGKTITLYDKSHNAYAVMEAPATIDAAIDKAHREYGLRVALADLTAGNAGALMTAGVKHALYVGEGVVRGVKCHHLAFDKKNIQWQIWIDAGEKPLPRKLIITEKKLPASPQWTAYFTEWNLAPQIAESLFVFAPPQGATKIKFVSLKEIAAQQQKAAPAPKKTKKAKGDKS